MNAALSKDKETVEFVWDSSHTDQVRIMFYDFANSNDSYRDTHEATVYARDFWKGLLESGFRSRITMRAELGKGPRSIVFVWKALTLADDQVRVFTYDGGVRVSADTLSISYGRNYWISLLSKGYRVIHGEVAQPSP